MFPPAWRDGRHTPNPPSLAGRLKRAHSESFGGGRLVSEGSRSVLSALSIG